jgi:hypothetical protein
MKKELNKTVTVRYMNKTQDFTIDEIKTIWDPSKTWTEATKDDPDEMYLYQYPNLPNLYIKYNGIKLPINNKISDFQ